LTKVVGVVGDERKKMPIEDKMRLPTSSLGFVVVVVACVTAAEMETVLKEIRIQNRREKH